MKRNVIKITKYIICIGLVMLFFISSIVVMGLEASLSPEDDKFTSQNGSSNMSDSILTRSLATATPVRNFKALKNALESGKTEVVLTGTSYKATSNIGDSVSINHDITIYGNEKVLDMDKYNFRLGGSNKLTVENLKIASSPTNPYPFSRYGVFQVAGSSSVWDAEFTNIAFEGTSLVGSTTYDIEAINFYFNKVDFYGDNEIKLVNSGAYHAAVFARNITISGNLNMRCDLVKDPITGNTGAVYQAFFRSPGSSSTSFHERDGTYSHGTFEVMDNAVVSLHRDASKNPNGTVQGTERNGSDYYKSLIFGYKEYIFGNNCSFTAQASTNRNTSKTERSAVIRSNNASEFTVKSGAQVKLETLAASKDKPDQKGWSALYLKKGATPGAGTDLSFNVEEGATLHVIADAKFSDNYTQHGSSPVMILGKGSSQTTIAGNLIIDSSNGNGWYFEDYVEAPRYGDQRFNVTGTGNVDIKALNLNDLGAETKGAKEYAAFEAYGNYNMYITVEAGGKMNVYSNSNRGMSLDGHSSRPQKQVYVEGDLYVYGVEWAISAENYPELSITAANGGKIKFETDGGDNSSTIYTVGTATYTVDGIGSKMDIYHNSGGYSAIYNDDGGILTIDIKNGGAMNIINENSGASNNSRAAICAQSTSSYGTNSIAVSGGGSSLYIYNGNTAVHSNSGTYPTGAVSFNSTAPGNIIISDGGSFTAISSSRSPTISLYNNSITFDNPGAFDIRNNSLSSTGGYATKGLAVLNSQNTTAIKFINCDVTVWSLMENKYDFADAYIDNSWRNVSFEANSQDIATTGKDGTGGDVTTVALDKFKLSSYGRIAGSGSQSPESVSLELTKVDSETGDPLQGAEFLLYYTEQNGQDAQVKYYYSYDAGSGTVSWLPDISSATKIISDDEGKAYAEGLISNMHYYLEETKAPDRHLITTKTSEFLAYSNTINLTITNDPVGSITITKYGDRSGQVPLEGSVFLLERENNDGSWTALKWDTNLNEWIEAEEGYTGEATDTGGKVKFDYLPMGKTYRLIETKAPSYEGVQYSLLKEPIIVNLPYSINVSEGSLPADGYYKVMDEENGSKTYYYNNLSYTVADAAAFELPDSGYDGNQPNMFIYLGIGILLLSLCIYVLYRKRKKCIN